MKNKSFKADGVDDTKDEISDIESDDDEFEENEDMSAGQFSKEGL